MSFEDGYKVYWVQLAPLPFVFWSRFHVLHRVNLIYKKDKIMYNFHLMQYFAQSLLSIFLCDRHDLCDGFAALLLSRYVWLSSAGSSESSNILSIYSGSRIKPTRFCDIRIKCWPIFEILQPSHSEVTVKWSSKNSPHRKGVVTLPCEI